MNRRWIIAVLLVGFLLAIVFAVMGAGLYGSPFGPGKTTREYTIYAAAILIGPVASSVALCFHRRRSHLAGASLILGAVMGTVLGLAVESDFRRFWGGVFALVVWLPMLAVGIRFSPDRLRRSFMNKLRPFTHPAWLVFLTLVSIVLWMPFGMGYYGVPWESSVMRGVMHCFTIGFLLIAAGGCFCALSPRLAWFRLVISLISLVVAVLGVFAMHSWMGRHVRPMLERKKAVFFEDPCGNRLEVCHRTKT